MSNKQKRYTQEFKDQAIELANSMGNTLEAARQLGVSDSAICSWRQKKSKIGINDNQHESQVDVIEENKRLRKENLELKQVNYILKRAAAYFSQDELKKSIK